MHPNIIQYEKFNPIVVDKQIEASKSLHDQ